MTFVARDVADVKEALQSDRAFLPRGGGSKTGLSGPTEDAEILDVSPLSGVVEHLPQEFTLTARAATPVKDAARLLAQEGQYLPFDPMFEGAGATLGGTVASGISGPGRARYGGVRDFILGVTLVDGTGTEIRGGGKVVKNAAGFDLPKLMVGSLGALGVLTEVSFKVFPAPEERATVRARAEGIEGAVELLRRVLSSPTELEAIDLEPSGTVWARLAGRRASLPARVDRLRDHLGGGDLLEDAQAGAFWQEALELAWISDAQVAVRVPLTPRRIAVLDARLPVAAARRYSGAGQVAWIGWPREAGSLSALHQILLDLDLRGLRVRGGEGARMLGAEGPREVTGRARRALDPEAKLVEAR